MGALCQSKNCQPFLNPFKSLTLPYSFCALIVRLGSKCATIKQEPLFIIFTVVSRIKEIFKRKFFRKIHLAEIPSYTFWWTKFQETFATPKITNVTDLLILFILVNLIIRCSEYSRYVRSNLMKKTLQSKQDLPLFVKSYIIWPI